MYTIYWLKSIDGIKLRLKRSVRTAGSVKLEELRREIAESLASRRRLNVGLRLLLLFFQNEMNKRPFSKVKVLNNC